MAEKIKKAKKGAKSSFYEVEAPMTAVKISLYGNAPENFDGKVITLDMTKNLRGRSLELRMRVKYTDGKLKAEPISAILTGSYIRRSMRRGSDYVEDSFSVECRDYKIRIKPFLITRRRVSRAVRKALRDTTKQFIESYVKIRSVRELFSDVISNKIQKSLSAKLKRVYPLAMCEIRFFEIEGEKANAEDVEGSDNVVLDAEIDNPENVIEEVSEEKISKEDKTEKEE